MRLNRRPLADDGKVVKPKVRLDVVVKIRERDETRARLDLAQAQRQATAAENLAAEARRKAQHDERQGGRAADWELTEVAHVESLRQAARAERAAQAAGQQLHTSRQSYNSAYRRAESMRRLAELRRSEVIAEQELDERKQLDEIGLLLRPRP